MRQGLNKKDTDSLKQFLRDHPKTSTAKAAIVHKVAESYVKAMKVEVDAEKREAKAVERRKKEEIFNEIKPLIVKLIDDKLKGYRKKVD